MMNKGITISALLLGALLSAGGCAVVIGNEISDGSFAEAIEEADREDIRLARTVERRLAEDPALAGLKLRASARKGSVTLHGELEDIGQLAETLRAVRAVPGVETVRLNITLSRD